MGQVLNMNIIRPNLLISADKVGFNQDRQGSQAHMIPTVPTYFTVLWMAQLAAPGTFSCKLLLLKELGRWVQIMLR